MSAATRASAGRDVLRYADMFAAIGTEARLRILRLLLSAHPDGLVAGDVHTELGIPQDRFMSAFVRARKPPPSQPSRPA